MKFYGNTWYIISDFVICSFPFVLVTNMHFNYSNQIIILASAYIAIILLALISTARLKLQISIDEKGIELYRAFLSSEPKYNWNEIHNIYFVPVLNILLLRTNIGHIIWITYIIKNHKSAIRYILEYALSENKEIEIGKKTKARLIKAKLLQVKGKQVEDK